jgi:hypothetical protein
MSLQSTRILLVVLVGAWVFFTLSDQPDIAPGPLVRDR